MRVSLCMPWRNRVREAEVSVPTWLAQDFHELVIIDDGSGPEDQKFLADLQRNAPARLRVNVMRLEDTGYKRYPLRAFNQCMEVATGDVLVQQSPEVAHLTPGLIRRLAEAVPPGGASFARVYDAPIEEVRRGIGGMVPAGEPWSNETARLKLHELPNAGESHPTWRIYTGHERPLPFFFCGAIQASTWREMGGYNEQIDSTFDYGADAEFADRMLQEGRRINGLGDALAVHIQHGRA